jgi:hypothetical protein
MGTINLVGSLRYDMTGRKRKTKSLKTKSKRTIYNELIATQQRQYDKVVKEVAQQYPSYVSKNTTGQLTQTIIHLHDSWKSNPYQRELTLVLQ